MHKIAVVLGTRPQIIKTAPVIKKLAKERQCQFFLVHTGQHHDFELSKVFFDEMKLPDPVVNLGVREDSHAKQTAAMMVGLERTMSKLAPDIVFVPGDTNSALAAALTAVKLKIPSAHLEAGPRQFDLSNPEEANRIVVDHLSTLAFAPTPSSVANLQREGFDKRRLRFTGDTMLDCLIEHFPSSRKIDLQAKFGVQPGFVFTTIHREENTEDEGRLKCIVQALKRAKEFRFLFPIHPRTVRCLKSFGLWRRLTAAENVHLISPLDYENTLAAVSQAEAVLTDSGGLQKEAIWLGVPCVTVFRTTPWPETLRHGANRCVEPKGIPAALARTESIEFASTRFFHLFGDGHASDRVCNILLNEKSTLQGT